MSVNEIKDVKEFDSILKNNRQESELKRSQDSLLNAQNQIIGKQNDLIELQKEMGSKSDEVIGLQKLLQEKSDYQLNEWNRLNNPIPNKFNVSFSSVLLLSNSEYDDVNNAIKSREAGGSNLLPFKNSVDNSGCSKINAFKNVLFEMIIVIQKDAKVLTIRIEIHPHFMGYNTSDGRGSFVLYSKDDNKVIALDCNEITVEDIKTNYSSPSLLDFDNSVARVSYGFGFPKSIIMGDFKKEIYIFDNAEYLILDIKEIQLETKENKITLFPLRKVNDHTFEGAFRYIK